MSKLQRKGGLLTMRPFKTSPIQVTFFLAALALSGQAAMADDQYTVREISGKGFVIYSPEGKPILEFPKGAPDTVNGKKITRTAVERAKKITERMNQLTAKKPGWRTIGKMQVKQWTNGEWVVTSGFPETGIDYVVTADKVLSEYKGWSAEAYAHLLQAKLAQSGVFRLMKSANGRQRAVEEVGWTAMHIIAEDDYDTGVKLFLKAKSDLEFGDALNKYKSAVESEPGHLAAYEGVIASFAKIKSSDKNGMYGSLVKSAESALPKLKETVGLRAEAESLLFPDKEKGVKPSPADYAKAEQNMTQAVKLFPTCATYYILLAEAQEKQGKLKEKNATLTLALSKAEVLGKPDEKWKDRIKAGLKTTPKKAQKPAPGTKH